MTRDKESPSDGLSPAPAPLKELELGGTDLAWWVRRVVETFRADEAAGYRSKSRTYAIEMLEKGLEVSALSPQPPTSDELLLLVDEFCGWWHLNREGNVNATYDYIDKMVKRLERLEGSPQPPTSEQISQLLFRYVTDIGGGRYTMKMSIDVVAAEIAVLLGSPQPPSEARK